MVLFSDTDYAKPYNENTPALDFAWMRRIGLDSLLYGAILGVAHGTWLNRVPDHPIDCGIDTSDRPMRVLDLVVGGQYDKSLLDTGHQGLMPGVINA